MSDRHYRTYADEFKREALELLKSSEKSAGQLELELGITPGVLLKWRDKKYPHVLWR
jgi:transposase-like protein